MGVSDKISVTFECKERTQFSSLACDAKICDFPVVMVRRLEFGFFGGYQMKYLRLLSTKERTQFSTLTCDAKRFFFFLTLLGY